MFSMYSRSSLLLPLAWSASYLSRVAADCNSFGIDFVNNGNYFINQASNESFTAVTQFTGCQKDVAAVELVNWVTGDEYLCSDIPLQPDGTPETSTCDIQKDDLTSGVWGLLLFSNNGDDAASPPFANQRTFTLDVGTQATSTVTPTLTFNQTITPTVTAYTTSVIVNTTTVNNSVTVTVPAATKYVTLTPPPAYTTSTISLTRTLKTWTRTAIISTRTVTASCTVPPRPQQPDPPCRFRPRLLKVPAGINIPGKRDEEVESYASIKKRLADIRARRAADMEARDLAKRSADARTVTVTQTTYTVNQTNTYTAPATTVQNIVVSTQIVYTTLPPATIKTGYAQATVTASAVTKTRVTVTTAYVWQTKTMTAKLTKVTIVTPTASVSACKSSGGHFGNGW